MDSTTLLQRWHHVVLGFAALTSVVVIGTVGYVVLGCGVLDALYQTVTTITTVGFREVEPLSGSGQIFTIVLIMAGVGTALYTLTMVLEVLVEGHVGAAMERRRMDREIATLRGHVIVCGWGRVGRAAADDLRSAAMQVVVVDSDAERARVGSSSSIRTCLRRRVGRRRPRNTPASTARRPLSQRCRPMRPTCSSRCRLAHCSLICSSCRRAREESSVEQAACEPAPTGS